MRIELPTARTATIYGALALGLLTAPLASQADTDAAMAACVKAFVAANLPKEQPVRVKKQGTAPDLRDDPGYGYRVTLTAIGSRSGQHLAKSVCLIDGKGEVISLDGRRLYVASAADAVPPSVAR